MKKTLILALAAAMLALPFAGCSNNSGSSSSQAQSPASSASQTADKTASGQSSAAAVDFSSELISSGKIIVGTSADYPPYESLGATGEIEGFDVDMIREIATYMSEAGVPIEVELKNMSFDTIVTALQVGQVDIGVSAFTYDPDRDVQFSTPYLVSNQMVTVAADSGLAKIEDLDGKRIGAGLGTTGEAAVIERVKAPEITNGDYPILFEALKNGALDAIVSDGLVAKNYAQANGFTVWEQALIEEENAMIVKNGNDALYAAVNSAVEKFINSDKYLELQKKWGIVGE